MNNDRFTADGAGTLNITGQKVTIDAWIKLEDNSNDLKQEFTAQIGKTNFPTGQSYQIVFEGGLSRRA